MKLWLHLRDDLKFDSLLTTKVIISLNLELLFSIEWNFDYRSCKISSRISSPLLEEWAEAPTLISGSWQIA